MNRAKVKTIFDENKFYVKGKWEEKLTWKSQGLLPFTDIAKKALPAKKVIERDKAFAIDWYKKNADKLIDYNKRKLSFNKNSFEKHISGKYIQKGLDGRQNLVEFIPEILNKADEVYLFEGRGSKTKIRYIKYYKNFVLNIIADITDTGIKINSWYRIERKKISDHIREGVLINKSDL